MVFGTARWNSFILLLKAWGWGFYNIPTWPFRTPWLIGLSWAMIQRYLQEKRASNNSKHFQKACNASWRASVRQVASKDHCTANFKSRMICALKKQLTCSGSFIYWEEIRVGKRGKSFFAAARWNSKSRQFSQWAKGKMSKHAFH